MKKNFNSRLAEFRRKLPIGIRLLKERLRMAINSLFQEKKFKRNVFHTDFKKYALLVTDPTIFKKKQHKKYHTISTEVYTIGSVLRNLGYNVDCTTDGNNSVKLAKYDVIGPSLSMFERIWKENISATTIRYSPGSHPLFCYRVTANKMMQVREAKQSWMPSSTRYLNNDIRTYYADMLADHIIVLGNEFILSKYLEEDPRPERYHRLNAFYFDCHKPDLDAKDFDNTRTHICWFGSLGLIHKGLDIAIDIALNHPEITLHICGATKREKEFWKYYAPLIKDRPNIIDHGFLLVDSEEFVEVMNQCAWLINPSISEGMSTAVLNVCANAGLVPIYTKATGIDLQEYGIELDDAEYGLFETAVLNAIKTDPEELRKKSKAVCEHVRQNYTYEQYQNNLLEIIKHCLSSKNNRNNH